MKIYDHANPIFHVVDDGYYVGVWYLAGREQDWLAMLYQNPDDTTLRLTHRFRYYKDDKLFDETDDEKSIYNAAIEGKTEDEAVAIVDALAQKLIAEGYLGTRLPWALKKRYTRRIVKCDGRAFGRVLQKLPFTHQKYLTTKPGSH